MSGALTLGLVGDPPDRHVYRLRAFRYTFAPGTPEAGAKALVSAIESHAAFGGKKHFQYLKLALDRLGWGSYGRRLERLDPSDKPKREAARPKPWAVMRVPGGDWIAAPYRAYSCHVMETRKCGSPGNYEWTERYPTDKLDSERVACIVECPKRARLIAAQMSALDDDVELPIAAVGR